MADSQSGRGRGRPPSETTVFLRAKAPEYLKRDGPGINRDVLEVPQEFAVNLAKTRREIRQHYQRDGVAAARSINVQRSADRDKRLIDVELGLQNSVVANMSVSSAAAHLSTQLGLNPHTLRKYIAEIRKLSRPSS